MTKLLVKLFIKNSNDTHNQKVRGAYGKLGSIVGIIANIFLFAGKLIVGILSASVSIIADAINNLSDSGSQIISLASFSLSQKPADKEHPYGHQRIEYVASMCVAFIIFILAFQLVVSSIDKIKNPVPINLNVAVFIILIVSIFAKLWLCLFNRTLGRRIDSEVMKATSIDSLSDVLATTTVLISAAITYFFPSVMLDGYMGIAVALFISVSGIKILKETMRKILGDAPSAELISMIEDKINTFENVLGIHDLIIHSYGPNKTFASVHVEVNQKLDFIVGHDLSDEIERKFLNEEGIRLVVHLDPINIDDEFTLNMHAVMTEYAAAIDLTIHDFRTVQGTTHSNILFDVSVPFGYKMTEDEVIKYFKEKLTELSPNYFGVISVDYIVSPISSSHCHEKKHSDE